MIRHTAHRGMPAAIAMTAILLGACGGTTTISNDPPDPSPTQEPSSDVTPSAPTRAEDPRGEVTLAFAGDMHFELHLAALLDHPRGALGPIARTLADADLTMVNLESAITGARHPGGQGARGPQPALPLPHLAGCARRPRGSGRRRGHDGEQPRRRLRAGRPGGHPRGDPQEPDPGGRHRPGPAGGFRAVPGLDPGHRLRLPRRGRLAAGGREQRLGRRADNPGHRRRPRRQAPRPPRRGPGRPAGGTTSWSSTCTGAPSSRAARPGSSGRQRVPWPTPAPTSSSAPTRTCSSGPDGWATPT